VPTIEFHGFADERLDDVAAEVAGLVSGMAFAKEIVLVRRRGSTVLDLDGVARPFLRILTRSPERAEVLRRGLTGVADIEVVFIQFYERGSE
jgi:hypothetical protein